MDYLDPKKKRSHLVRLYIGYMLMAIAISFGTYILVYLARGFDVDRKTGEVIQNGLIILDSKPHSASIYLNGKLEHSKTSTRVTVPAGSYLVELRREGYRLWHRQISLDGGSVESLAYPRIFPEKLTTTNLQAVAAVPRAVSQSPDRRYIVMQFEAQPDTLAFFDTTQPDKAAAALIVPHNVLINPNELGKLDVVDWSTDNRRILLTNSLPNRIEYLMLDRQDPSASFSLNKLFNLGSVKITLRDRRIDQFYALGADGILLSLDSRGTPQSSRVLSGVLDFVAFGQNTLVYITADGAAKDEVQARFKDGDKTYPLRLMPKGSNYNLALASYSNDWYMTVGLPSEGKVYIYRNPHEYLKSNPDKRFPVPVSVLKLETPQFVTFSSDYSIVGVQNGSKFAVYDNENNRQFQYQLSLAVPATQKVYWMDGHHLCTVVGGVSLVSDFDGANQQQLATGLDNVSCLFDKNYLHAYNFATTSAAGKNTTNLTSTLLELVNEPSDNIFGF